MLSIIEETGWIIDQDSFDQDMELIECILDLMDSIRNKAEILYCSELFYLKICGDLTFYDLYGADGPCAIPPAIKERFAAAFLTLGRWDERADWPDDLDVKVGDQEARCLPSTAYAHAIASGSLKKQVSIISLGKDEARGLNKVTVRKQSRQIFFLKSIPDWPSYSRHLVLDNKSDATMLRLRAEDAFPNVSFVDGALEGIFTMSKPYVNLIEVVVRHLSAFSDHGPTIFQESWQQAAQQFGSLGVNISDENGNTKSNRAAKKLRTRNFEGSEIIFWWHSKLERDRDRIHIWFDNRTKRVVVGILCRHL